MAATAPVHAGRDLVLRQEAVEFLSVIGVEDLRKALTNEFFGQCGHTIHPLSSGDAHPHSG